MKAHRKLWTAALSNNPDKNYWQSKEVTSDEEFDTMKVFDRRTNSILEKMYMLFFALYFEGDLDV